MTKDRSVEEPCAGNLASTVLKTSGESDLLAEFDQILRRAVLHRKNSLFYRSSRGAETGDVLCSLIETCSRNKVNAFHYLVAILSHTREMRACPSAWLPWNYLEQLTSRAA